MGNDDRKGILDAVKTEIGLLALIALVVETAIGLLATQVDKTAVPGIIWGMLGILALVIAVAAVSVVVNRHGPAAVPASQKEPANFDVFISAPMAAFTDKKSFEENNKDVLRVIEALRNASASARIFYAGQGIKTMDDFEPADTSLDKDFQAILQSRALVMIYPEKLASGALVEAGFALGAGKPSYYFVKDEHDLPFILRLASQAKTVDVRVYPFTDYDNLCKQIVQPSRSRPGACTPRPNRRHDPDGRRRIPSPARPSERRTNSRGRRCCRRPGR